MTKSPTKNAAWFISLFTKQRVITKPETTTSVCSIFNTIKEYETVIWDSEYAVNDFLNLSYSWFSALKYLTVSKFSKQSVAF
jgi:hypothetical protein